MNDISDTSEFYTTCISTSSDTKESNSEESNNEDSNSYNNESYEDCIYCKNYHSSLEKELKCRNKFYNNTFISYNSNFSPYKRNKIDSESFNSDCSSSSYDSYSEYSSHEDSISSYSRSHRTTV